MKNYHFLPVFLTLLGSYIALHFYSAAWLARNFSLDEGSARAIRRLFLLLAFLAPFTMFLRHNYTGSALDPVCIAGYSWMGIIFIAGFTFLFSDLLALGLQRLFTPQGAHYFRIGTTVFLGIIIPYAFHNGLKAPALKQLRLSVPGLPAAMEGLKIAQISDLHIDSPYKLKLFSKTVDLVNAQNPDLVLITGDLLDPGLASPPGQAAEASSPQNPPSAGIKATDLTCNARLGELVRKLKPRLGLYGVLGNHEYYFGYERSLACYKQFGIKLLRNESADISGFRIIGLSDIMTEKMSEKDVRDILKKHRKEEISILMSHQPIMQELIAETGNFIGFSGHTHRGQIFPFHIFTRMVYKHFYGLYRLKNSFFYVTSGAGTWGPPMRLFAPPEIPLVTLSGK